METIELIKRSRAGDKLAREQVIKANMPLVYSIVKRRFEPDWCNWFD